MALAARGCEMENDNDKERILSLSYGKDSLACIGACELLGWRIDRIIHAEVWATDTIPADLPPMVEFKAKADKIIKERWGIEVEHIRSKWCYESYFYRSRGNKAKYAGRINGFPMQMRNWCVGRLKTEVLGSIDKSGISYIGIAVDEPNRFHSLSERKLSPLVEAGWTEAMCREWCEKNDLLSPIYTTATRGGCWFCHNQGVEQLRLLRANYPELWALLLKWDKDSPVSFKPDGHTVHDYDERFRLEDEKFLDPNGTFRWKMLDEPLQMRMF